MWEFYRNYSICAQRVSFSLRQAEQWIAKSQKTYWTLSLAPVIMSELCQCYVSSIFSLWNYISVRNKPDDEAEICTIVVLVVESRQVAGIYFYPVGKSESVVYIVCIYEFTLHSDCGSKWDPSLTLHAHTHCCVCGRGIGWQVQDI